MTFYIGQKKAGEIFLGDKNIGRVYLGQKLVHMTQKAGGRFVESIVFDGNSWIDTSFNPHPHTTRTVLDCMLLDNMSTGGQGMFGARPITLGSINSMNLWFNTSDANKRLRLDCTGDTQVRSDVIDITQRLLIDCLDNKATVNGVTYSANVDKSNTTYLAYSMYLGNFNNVGSPYTKGCKMNCYKFAIYDNDTLAHDFRPYVDGNGIACFKDVVTDTLFYNQGTGRLQVGGKLDLSKFEIIGKPTISENGIVSGFSNENYLTTKSNFGLPTANKWSIIFPTVKVNAASKYFWGADMERSGIVLAINKNMKIVVYISSNGAQWDIAAGADNLYSTLEFSQGEEVSVRLDFTGSKYVLYILKDNVWQEQTSVTSTLKVGNFEYFRIGQWTSAYYWFDGSIDLKTFTVLVDGKVITSMN